MKHLKTYTLFESSKETKLFESNLDEYEQIINWKLIDLTDSEFVVSTQKLSGYNGSDKVDFIAISIRRSPDAQPREIEGSPNPPGGLYPKEIFVWREVKESVIELIRWWSDEFSITDISKKNKPHGWKTPIKLASGGTYFADACETTDQLINTLEGLGDLISFTVLRIQLQITE